MPMGPSSIRLVGYYLLCTIAEKSRKGTTFFSTYQIILLFFCLTTKGVVMEDGVVGAFWMRVIVFLWL